MKRFIIISLLSALALPILACAWQDTHNFYLFHVYDDDGFALSNDQVTISNWKAYLGLADDEYFYFDADVIIEAARKKNDLLMVSYVQNLQKYLDCVDIEQQKLYEWDYPTKEEIAAQQRDLQTVRAYAQSQLKTRLRSQHALLFMRCNMMLGNHQENITFWEQTASQYIKTVYKDMMMNIYAGALYKTGREEEAGELFAEMGDYKSLMTQYYKKRSYQAIRSEYQKNPNAKVLPFLLQDFVNNAQEAADAKTDMYLPGKLFIRDLTNQEVQQMINFCAQVVRENKTDVPILWMSAKAWLEYMFGNKQQALTDITEACGMNGSGWTHLGDNAKTLRLYIASAVTPKKDLDFDYWLSENLQWLAESAREPFSYYRCAYDRIAHQVLSKRFMAEGRPERALALLKQGEFSYTFEAMADTMEVGGLLSYKKYIETPAKNMLDRFLKAKARSADADEEAKAQTAMADLIGTKYMRLCQWDKAIEWLEKVPARYYDEQGWAVYAAYRSPTVEPWIRRQWLNQDILYSENRNHLYINPKLKFARDMQEMEAGLNVLQGKALDKRRYDLAVRYAQANFRGDCWWLMRNGKGVCDTLRVNEADLAAKAKDLLQKVSQTSDIDLKEKALFALGWRELYADNYWKENVWDNEAGKYVSRYNHQSPQYRAYQTLYEFLYEEPEESMYVSRCDEFKQFRTYYWQHRQ